MYNNNNNNNDFILRGGSVGQVQSSLRSSVKTTCTNIYNAHSRYQQGYSSGVNTCMAKTLHVRFQGSHKV